MAGIDYTTLIPNNVSLHENRRLQRALEDWQPKFLEWWQDMGPNGYQAKDVYLRTATSVDAQGWAHFGSSVCPSTAGGFPRRAREGAWSTSATTRASPRGRRCRASTAARFAASSTQGTRTCVRGAAAPLGRTCPSPTTSATSSRSTWRGPALWAWSTSWTRTSPDGREESEALLQRRWGRRQAAHPGRLQRETPDWLSFFCSVLHRPRWQVPAGEPG